MRRRLLNIGCSSAIFLTAIAMITLLARAPFGEIYKTALGRAEGGDAAVTLAGVTKPEVSIVVTEKEGVVLVTVGLKEVGEAFEVIEAVEANEVIEGPVTTTPDARLPTPHAPRPITLSLPSSFRLEEVRGVHVSDVAKYPGETSLVLMIPREQFSQAMERGDDVVFRFSTLEPLTAITFSHDSGAPALLTVTRILLPSEETARETFIVEQMRTVELPN